MRRAFVTDGTKECEKQESRFFLLVFVLIQTHSAIQEAGLRDSLVAFGLVS